MPMPMIGCSASIVWAARQIIRREENEERSLNDMRADHFSLECSKNMKHENRAKIVIMDILIAGQFFENRCGIVKKMMSAAAVAIQVP